MVARRLKKSWEGLRHLRVLDLIRNSTLIRLNVSDMNPMHLNLDPLQLEFIRVYRSPKLIGLEYSSHVVKKHLGGGLDTPQGSRSHTRFHLNNA